MRRVAFAGQIQGVLVLVELEDDLSAGDFGDFRGVEAIVGFVELG